MHSMPSASSTAGAVSQAPVPDKAAGIAQADSIFSTLRAGTTAFRFTDAVTGTFDRTLTGYTVVRGAVFREEYTLQSGATQICCGLYADGKTVFVRKAASAGHWQPAQARDCPATSVGLYVEFPLPVLSNDNVKSYSYRKEGNAEIFTFSMEDTGAWTALPQYLSLSNAGVGDATLSVKAVNGAACSMEERVALRIGGADAVFTSEKIFYDPGGGALCPPDWTAGAAPGAPAG